MTLELGSDGVTHLDRPLLWSNTVDDRWYVEVRRLSQTDGVLLVFDQRQKFRVVHKQVVGWSHAVICFAPSETDFAAWRKLVGELTKSWLQLAADRQSNWSFKS